MPEEVVRKRLLIMTIKKGHLVAGTIMLGTISSMFLVLYLGRNLGTTSLWSL